MMIVLFIVLARNKLRIPLEGTYRISRVRLIIKHVDNQVEDANYHINQYLSKTLIVTR